MRKPALTLGIFLILACVIAASATVVFTTEQPVRLVCDIWPPYQMRDQDGITGFSTEMVTAVFKRMGTPVQSLEAFPWKRALEILESGHAEALFSANYTRDRDIFAHYPSENLFDSPWIIWTRTETAVRTLDDLKGKSVGVVIGYSYTRDFWEFIQTHCKVEQVTTDEINLQKLANHRLDAVAAEYGNALHIIRNLGLKGITPRRDVVIKSDGLYIIFNRTGVGDAFVHRFAEELKIFKTTPQHQALRAKYFGEPENR
ncbi:MAG: transporter substrate-binding domain-containing protein [Pseudodesulfovibrio sp.]